jgi:hypothetical protein
MSLINYKLQDIHKISPFGSDDNLSLHWFGLTDGLFRFKEEIKSFGVSFFDVMDTKVELAIGKDFGEIQIDKKMFVEENESRKSAFLSALEKLDEESPEITNWDHVDQLTMEMRNVKNQSI